MSDPTPTRSVYVGNVPFASTEESLMKAFAAYDPVAVKFIADKGVAFLEVPARLAYSMVRDTDGSKLEGRLLSVSFARPRANEPTVAQDNFQGSRSEGPPRGDRYRSDRPPYRPNDGAGPDRPANDRPRNDRPHYERPQNDRPQYDRPQNDRPQNDRPHYDRPSYDRGGDRPNGYRSSGNRPEGDRPYQNRGNGPRPGYRRDEGNRPYQGTERPQEPRGDDRPSGPRPEGSGGYGQRRDGGWRPGGGGNRYSNGPRRDDRPGENRGPNSGGDRPRPYPRNGDDRPRPYARRSDSDGPPPVGNEDQGAPNRTYRPGGQDRNTGSNGSREWKGPSSRGYNSNNGPRSDGPRHDGPRNDGPPGDRRPPYRPQGRDWKPDGPPRPRPTGDAPASRPERSGPPRDSKFTPKQFKKTGKKPGSGPRKRKPD